MRERHPERSGSALAAIALAALVVASAFITPGTRDLIFGEESRYARIAAEMATAGAWLIPSLDGQPYTDKPPLHFDAVVALGRILGFRSAWTFILPSLLSFALLTAVVGSTGRRWFGREAGAMAAFVFATFLFTWGSAQTARMDLEYALLFTVAAILLYESMARGRTGAALLAGVAAGVAVLVKGPAVAAILILIWGAESIRLRRRPRLADLGGLALLVGIPSSWVALIAAREGGWVAFDLVVTQNLGRAVDSFAHAKPPWFYLERFPLIFFPWFVLLILALIAVARRGERGAAGYCGIWFAAIVLFFSAVSGKLDVYLLPATAPAALLIGSWIAALAPREGRTVVAIDGVMVTLAALLLVAAPFVVRTRVERTPEVELLLGSPFHVVALIAGLAALAAAIAHAVPAGRVASRSLLMTGAAFMTGPVAAAILMTGFMNDVYSSRPLVDVLRAHGLEHASLVVYEGFHPWRRDFEFEDPSRIRMADPWTLKKATVLPGVVVTRTSRATELGPPLRQSYEKIASIRIRRKDYDVYRLRDGRPAS